MDRLVDVYKHKAPLELQVRDQAHVQSWLPRKVPAVYLGPSADADEPGEEGVAHRFNPFVGGDRIQAAEAALQFLRPTAAPLGLRCVELTGSSGVGKSNLATLLGSKLRGVHPVQIWIYSIGRRAEQQWREQLAAWAQSSLKSCMGNEAQTVDEILHHVRVFFERHAQEVLVVLDDAKAAADEGSLADMVRAFAHAHGIARVVVTSKDGAPANDAMLVRHMDYTTGPSMCSLTRELPALASTDLVLVFHAKFEGMKAGLDVAPLSAEVERYSSWFFFLNAFFYHAVKRTSY